MLYSFINSAHQKTEMHPKTTERYVSEPISIRKLNYQWRLKLNSKKGNYCQVINCFVKIMLNGHVSRQQCVKVSYSFQFHVNLI